MKIIISESAGRNQAWFDAQTKIVQRQYLADHPNSKFVAKKSATAKRSAAAPVPVRTLKRDIKAKQAELDEHLDKKPRSEASKARHAATTKELQSSLRKLSRQHAKATETLAGQDRVLKAIDSKKPAAAKSPVKVKRGVPANPKKPARFAGPASHPSNRGTGNTVMGPGWKKKSGVGEHEWNTYEHPDGHQVRVSKTAGTAYQQGQGPARKVKVHKVETKAAGSKEWSNYGEVEKHQVSGAGRSFPKAKREKEIPDYALGDKNYVERKALESAKDRAHKRASDADTMMRVLLNRRGVPDKASMDALKAKIAKANAQATELEAKIKALK
jgi:hypothetical protein